MAGVFPISIHAPREGGDRSSPFPLPKFIISIHAPREGGDFHELNLDWIVEISIHAPREGGDFRPDLFKATDRDFNPRPPRGGRLPAGMTIFAVTEFQSTPPARGATWRCEF